MMTTLLCAVRHRLLFAAGWLLVAAMALLGCRGEPDAYGLWFSKPSAIGGTLLDVAPQEYFMRLAWNEPFELSALANAGHDRPGVTIRVSHVGGSLQPAQVGLPDSFPLEFTGGSPQAMSLAGTAATPGTIELNVTAEDGVDSASWSLRIEVNAPPLLAEPAGPGTVSEADGAFEATVEPGQSLAFSVSVTESDGDEITLTLRVTGGTLTASEAGFADSFPLSAVGFDSLQLATTGTAAMYGTIVLTATADDGLNAVAWVLTIRINQHPQLLPPTGPGNVTGSAGMYEAHVSPGQPMDFVVEASAGAPYTLSLTHTGGSLSPSAAGLLTPFPAGISGSGAQTLAIHGFAIAIGTLELTARAEDDVSSTWWVLTIRINTPPSLAAPTGPGVVATVGLDAYHSTVYPGEPLDLMVSATDPDAGAALALTVSVTGGTLSAAAAGFATSFPATATGGSPQSLQLTGTAAAIGTIELTVLADDGWQTRFFVLTIAIKLDPVLDAPNGPGTVTGGPTLYVATVPAFAPLDFSIRATDGDPQQPLTITATITGGTITPSVAGFASTFPHHTSGTSPLTLDFAGFAGTTEGTVVIRIEARDSVVGLDTVYLAVTIVAQPPQFTNAPQIEAEAGRLWQYKPQVIATPTATITPGPLPSWLSWNGTTLSGMPSAADLPTAAITLTASNGLTPNAIQVFTIEPAQPRTWRFVATNETFNAVWGTGPSNVYVVGNAGSILHFDGSAWRVMETMTEPLTGIWGSAADDIFVVGFSGAIYHYDGSSWSAMNSGTSTHLRGVWGSGPADVYAVGNWGEARHYDGTNWSPINLGSTQTYEAIWGSAANNIYACHQTTLRHFDGTAWSPAHSAPTWLRAIHGTGPNEVYVAGIGAVYVYNGLSWSTVPFASNTSYNGVYALSSFDVRVVGQDGAIWHFNGSIWSAQTSGTQKTLHAVWGSSGTDVYAVGESGTILHFNGVWWQRVFGSEAGRHRYSVRGRAIDELIIVGDRGEIQHYDGATFDDVISPSGYEIYDVWVASRTQAWSTGANLGYVLHYDGTQWSEVTGPSGGFLHGIWGTAPDNLFVTGNSGFAARYNGTSWTTLNTGTSSHLRRMWGTSSSNLYVAGGLGVFRYNGSSWSQESVPSSQSMWDVWGSGPSDIFAVGNSGSIVHYNGANWSSMTSGTSQSLRAVHGRSPHDVWAVGENGTVCRFDGTNWNVVPVPTNVHLRGVWVDPASLDVILVGHNGVVLRYTP